MQNSKTILYSFRKLLGRDRGNLVEDVIFFSIFYIYLWLIVCPHIIYHSVRVSTDFPVFFSGWHFFQEVIPCPGGPIKYIVAFLYQLFCFSWAGAFIITVQAWLICICIENILKTINASFLQWSRFVPPTLLLVIYSRYVNYLATTTALLMALFFICIYMKTISKSLLLRSVIFLILSVVLYYLTGVTLLFFGLICIIYDLFFINSWKSALIYLVYILIIPYIGSVIIFNTSISEVFSEPLTLSYTILDYKTHKNSIEIIYLLYLYLPLSMFIFWLWYIHLNKAALSSNQQYTPHTSLHKIMKMQNMKLFSRYNIPAFKCVFKSTILFIIAGVIVSLSHDYKTKTILEVDYYACHKQWSKVLQVFNRYPRNDFVIHAVNRALYHTNGLPYDMFSYPQHYKHISSLLLTSNTHKDNHWEKIDAYIDLGFINWAEYKLNESMEQYGPRHVILKRLALVSMVKNNIKAARIYLEALSKTLFYNDWSNNYLEIIETDPDLSTDKKIQQLRSLMMKKDYTLISFNGERILLDLLAANKTNRMAFEYLMTYYMLSLQIDKVIQNIYRLDDFNYPQIPQLYEEAILLYKSRTKKTVELHGRQISPQTVLRFNAFFDILKRHRSDKNSAREELENYFGNSYLFYSIFGSSGAVNERTQNSF